MYRIAPLLLSGLIFWTQSFGQWPTDSTRLNFPDAERLFLQTNLQLLAEQFNVSIGQALKQQAGFWDNPFLTTDQNIYDGKFFRHREENGQYYGQVYIQLQQLIRTAGKRGKLIRLAGDELASSQARFNDLLRQLRYLLTLDFGQMNQLLQKDSLYVQESGLLQKLARGMRAEWQAGDISEKDLVRVQALQFSLDADHFALKSEINHLQQDLQLLLGQGDSSFIIPLLPARAGHSESIPLLQELTDSSLARRPDLLDAQINLQSENHNLQYQRALQYPDLTVGAEYDRSNSYIPHYYGLTVALPLPLFNRNKGNIRAAELATDQGKLQYNQKQQAVVHEVVAAYQSWMEAQSAVQLAGDSLAGPYRRLLQNMVNSYSSKQVGLVELIDFFDAYRESREKELELNYALWQAAAELNYVTAHNFIPIP